MSQPQSASIARIDVEPAYRPAWYRDDAGTHVPLPPPTVTRPAEDLPGEAVVWADRPTGRLPLVTIEAGRGHIRHEWSRWRRFVLAERYRTLTRPLYTRLPFHYHRIPGAIRRLAARAMLAGQSPGPEVGFPGFPIEQGFELLAHVWAQIGEAPGAPDRTSDIVLTHDIDTGDGFDWVKPTAELELAHGFQSTWHVVGRGDPPDHGVLDWLVDHGCTIGLHGYNHDNQLAFLPADRIRRRLDACLPLMTRYDVRCFRSPSWFRTDTLFEVLKEYIAVDYSVLDTDRSCPGGVGGCLWTKRFESDGLTHVPTTIPFEDPLYWGHSPEQLVDFWRPKIGWLQACGGNIVVNTHPEPQFSGNATMLRAYDQLLHVLADIECSTGPDSSALIRT